MSMSVTDICNRALAMAGSGKRIENVSEDSSEAKTCRLFYEECRASLISKARWNFTEGVEQLALTTDIHPVYSYVYMYPSGCLRVNRVFAGAVLPDTGKVIFNEFGRSEGAPFEVIKFEGGRRVCCNAECALASVTRDVRDVSEFPPLFEKALVCYLASELAIPISGGNMGTKQALHQQFLSAYYEAVTNLANEGKVLPEREFEEYLDARR